MPHSRRVSPRLPLLLLTLSGLVTASASAGPMSELDKLRQGLQKPNERDRVDAITKWNGPDADAAKAAEIIVGVLGDKSAQVQQAAAGALVKIGAKAVPTVTQALKAPDVAVRRQAVNVVGAMKPADVKPALPTLTTLIRDPDQEVKNRAGTALARFKDDALPLLVDQLKNTDGRQHWPAIANLVVKLSPQNQKLPAEMAAVLTKHLEHKETPVRAAAMQVLLGHAPRAKDLAPAVARLLGDSDAKIRQSSAEMLRQSQSAESLWPLAAASADEKVEVRRAVAAALQQLANLPLPATSPSREKGIAALTKALADPEPAVRGAAATILLKASPDPAVALAMLGTKDVPARTAAANSIAASGKAGKEALPLLADAVKSNDIPLRTAGLNALIKLLPESRTILAGLLSEKDQPVRLATVKGLYKSGQASIADVLVIALKDGDGTVRTSAEQGLAKLGAAALPVLTTAAKAGNVDAIKPLARYGKAGVDLLIELTGHKELPVRLAALDGLGEVRPLSKEAAGELKKLLEDRQVEVRNAAMLLLLRPDAPGIENKDLMLRALHERDWQVRRAAGQKLASLRGAVLPSLIELAEKGRDAAARAEAIHAMGLMGPSAVPAVKPLIDLVRSDKAELQPFRIHALSALDKMYPEADAGLLGILVDADPAAQIAVLEMLRTEQVKLARPLVVALLRSKNPDISSAAARALTKLGPEAGKELAALLEDKEGEVRAAAVQSVGSFVPVETLAKLLGDDKLVVSEAAGRALAKREAGAYSVLAEALRSKDFRVQVAAANAIVPVEDCADDLLPVLVDVMLAKDSRDLELQATARAIHRVNPMRAARHMADRASTAELLALLKKPAVEVQELACLALAEPRLRLSAAGEALPALTDLLKQPKTDVAVLAAAARAINALSPRDKGQTDQVAQEAAQRLAPDLVARLVKGTHEKSSLLREEIMTALQNQVSSQGTNSAEAILAALQLGQLTDDANHWLAYHAGMKEMTEEDAPNFVRILALYHSGNKKAPAHLTGAAEQALKEQFFRYLTDRGTLSQAPPIDQVRTTMPINQLRGIMSTYLALEVLKDDPTFKDRSLHGKTLQDVHQAWTVWWREWARERALQGMWSEMGLPDHQTVIWPCLLNMYDCAGDAVVKQRFKMLLDVTAIEEEQISIGGTRAGRRGKADAVGCGLDQWKDVLQGEQPRRLGESTRGLSGIVWTSGYQLPPAAILLRKLNRPVSHYDIVNRHFFVGSVFAHATPHYILGCQLSQPVGTMELFGTWHRLVFDDMNAIFYPLASGERRHIQRHNVCITGWTGNRAELQSIRYTSNLKTVEKGGWLFLSNGPAFASIFVEGGYTLEKTPPAGMNRGMKGAAPKGPVRPSCDAIVFKVPQAVIILHAGDVHKFGSFEKFQEAVLNAPLAVNNVSLRYTGPQAEAIEFFRRGPVTGGVPIKDGTAKIIYDSPYLQNQAGQPRITVRVGSYAAVYDFDSNLIK